jgi:hypothetical protein
MGFGKAYLVNDVQQVLSDPSLQVTAKQQLVNARIGQGLFRSRVELIEPCCRVTGVTDRRVSASQSMTIS